MNFPQKHKFKLLPGKRISVLTVEFFDADKEIKISRLVVCVYYSEYVFICVAQRER